MKNDPWLDKWLDLIKQRSANGLVLELGCGDGWDTVDLLAAECNVIAADISTKNLGESKRSVPGAKFIQLDNGQSLPFADRSVDVIVASLSLHYFTWIVTMQISSELRRCLQPDGILLARFNSTHDYNYGASPTSSDIEPNFRLVETSTKRFFDEESVRTFLQGWDIQFLEENTIHRYDKPKSVWETMAVAHEFGSADYP
ncbi:MAG: class I SAM-dependent methyltransferase [Anaerolineales bacterium]